MCEFISFKIEKSPEGLQVRTGPSLSDHSEIPGNGYEGEWTPEGLCVRVPPDVSDNIKDELEAFVRKTYKTQERMADKLIEGYLTTGVLPFHFYNHSKMNVRKLRLFSCDCAERVLPLFEGQYPDDKRPRETIETARQFAKGKVTKDQLDAAWVKASVAATVAEMAAARTAARTGRLDAKSTAAIAAARTAARTAEYDTKWVAEWVEVCEMAWETAMAAEMAVAKAAEPDAKSAAEWVEVTVAEEAAQASILLRYINKK